MGRDSWNNLKRIIWRLEEKNQPSYSKADLREAIHREVGLSKITVEKYRKLIFDYGFLKTNRWQRYILTDKKP